MSSAVFKISCIVAAIFCCSVNVYAQQKPIIKLSAYATAMNNLRELKPIEKLYLQTDKPNYSVGDTLRFKVYLLNADYLTPATGSGLLYVELDNLQGKNAKRLMVPVINGLAWGDIPLDSIEVPNGNYTLRAYTNWMRNFGEDYIFKKNITISKSADNPLLVKAAFKQTGDKVEANLQFSLLDGRIQAFKDVELKVMNGRRNLSKDKVVTGADGTVKVNFETPEGSAALSIQATALGGVPLNIPVSITRKENTDVQFMPEGGMLVAGLPSKVGFKAVGEDGKGINLKGVIADGKGKQVSTFAATHAGMGSFEFTPKEGETYLAKVDGINRSYILPLVKTTGTILSLKQTKDSVRVTIMATNGASGAYNLIGQANGLVCFAKTITLNAKLEVVVDKSLFPTGIARFTLFKNYQPLNERMVFIDNYDKLNISISTQKAAYAIRDSLGLNITVKDKDGNPVQGNFSVAVTDNSQIKLDSLGSNILNNLLLTSDLKGDIEQPGYYFTTGKEADLDNLLLTQGWVGYNWQEAFQPKLPYAYKPEKEFAIKGTVTTALGTPIERSNVVLVANRPLLFKDTLTDNTGRFTFKGLFPIDTAIFKLQARNKRGNDMNVKIDMDEFNSPIFAPSPLSIPWYLNMDSIALNNSRSKIAEERALSSYRGEGNVLKEATIKAKKVIPGSKNLNGPGEADQIIDEEELKKADKMTMEEFLYKKIRGFGMIGYPELRYRIYMNTVHFIIDGIDLDFFYSSAGSIPFTSAYMLYIKRYLEYYTAEDVIGLEVMFQPKYAKNYGIRYQPYMPKDPAYIEITTRAKKGPFMKVTPGTYLYKTLPFSIAKEFYSPKYTVKNRTTAMGTDLRSTIFWQANVVTDKDGKASLSFYAADKASNYTVVVEGTDMDGGLGHGKRQVIIK